MKSFIPKLLEIPGISQMNLCSASVYDDISTNRVSRQTKYSTRPHVRIASSGHMLIVQTSSPRPNKQATPNCAVLTCTRVPRVGQHMYSVSLNDIYTYQARVGCHVYKLLLRDQYSGGSPSYPCCK